jgi:hypothetical protein
VGDERIKTSHPGHARLRDDDDIDHGSKHEGATLLSNCLQQGGGVIGSVNENVVLV